MKAASTSVTAKPAVVPPPVAQATPAASTQSTPTSITVLVVDAKSQPAKGASVSMTPSNASGLTDSSGKIQFQLGTASKYEITASAGGKTVTVPYYAVPGGASQIVVNPVYVESVEAKLRPSTALSTILPIAGIILGLGIIGFIVWKIIQRRKETKAVRPRPKA